MPRFCRAAHLLKEQRIDCGHTNEWSLVHVHEELAGLVTHVVLFEVPVLHHLRNGRRCVTPACNRMAQRWGRHALPGGVAWDRARVAGQRDQAKGGALQAVPTGACPGNDCTATCGCPPPEMCRAVEGADRPERAGGAGQGNRGGTPPGRPAYAQLLSP